MNNKHISFALLGLAVMASSCAKHDLLDDKFDIGSRVPTTYWEVGSTTCKAGESFSFKGKYYTQDGYLPTHSEVWYEIQRDESAAATVKLAGSLNYTQTVNDTRIIRANQSVISFPHSLAEWDGSEYIITAEVPTSSTLAPLSWVSPQEWDQQSFESYYPKEFADTLCKKVIDYLTKDSTYYSNLRIVYINYPFTNEQFADANAKFNVNFPTDIKTSSEADASSDKSDRWFSTTTADPKKVVGYYYYTVNDLGQTIIHEVPLDYVNPDVNLYPVYESAPWVFCRYNDDAGAILSTVRAEYMPAFKYLLGQISFPEWIFDSAEGVYSVAFQRNYSLNSQFRVYDNEGHEGVASDVRVISLN